MGNDFEYVNKLGHSQALDILRELCADDDLKARISNRAKELLTDVDAADIEDMVFNTLNSIDVMDLWEDSGDSYFGYNDPTEVAYDMVEDAVSDLLNKMKECRKLGLKETEKRYCIGIVAGLLKYGNEGTNEFHDSVPDDPYDIADDIVAEWEELHPDDVLDIRAAVGRFVESEDTPSILKFEEL